MEKIVRDITPTILYRPLHNEYLFFNKGKAWRANYLVNNQASRFQWGSVTINGVAVSINTEIIQALQLISNEHCHYCDRKQVRKGDVRPTIDHFCPKTVKPIKAFYWSNLFLACDSCQEYKLSKFSKKYLLKFDEENYEFNDYFIIDFATHRICSRLDISPLNRCKARYTLLVLGINKNKRAESRFEEFNSYENTQPHLRDIENFSFRYFILRNVIV